VEAAHVLRLYRAPWSTNVERVALALAHKRLEAESVWISYADRTPVVRVSGQGLVPVLEHDGRVVVDSMEIVRYLDERFPDPPLYPSGAARRAEMIVFTDWFNRVWKVAPNAIEAEQRTERPDGRRIAALAAGMSRHLDLFEAMLEGRSHLFGEDLSAADVCAHPFLKYAAGREPADDELFHRVLEEHQSLHGRPRVAAWIERVGMRPRA
jgi:glutathione S-transferase